MKSKSNLTPRLQGAYRIKAAESRTMEPPRHIHRCEHCSNFMNWQRLWGGRWRCLNCGRAAK